MARRRNYSRSFRSIPRTIPSSLRYPRGRDIVNHHPIASVRTLPRRIYTKQLLLDIARPYGHDNRAYNPLPKAMRPARQVSGRISSMHVPKHVSLKRAKPVFSIPDRTLVCVRRGVRKEVIFAKQRAGRNGAKNYRRNHFSNVSC